MLTLLMDTETYSEAPIKEVGSFKYISHPSTRCLCLSYKINNDRVKLWTEGMVMPQELIDAAKLCSSGQGKAEAFNATFDMQVWNKILVPKHDIPVIPLENWVDVQAVCARFKLPMSLDKAAKALGCNTEKMAIGKQLIRKCCTPGYNPTARDYEQLGAYCVVDTEVLSEIRQKLPVPYLTPQEQAIWEMTYRINERGVPIDITANRAIIKYLKIYMDGQKKLLPELTKGFITTPGQIQKIKQFCKDKGVDLPNLQAETVEATLARDDLPYDVKAVLRLRQELGMSSVKKFITIDEMQNRGVVQGNLMYHGAGTGRWAGRGFQFHNLPRASVEDPEKVIQQFIDRDIFDDPVGQGKALIRSMITAPEDFMILCSDYSSIENRVLAWLAGDEATIQKFKEDFDQYKDMAAFLYNKGIDQVEPSERQLGKALILGCGFGMSHHRFVVAAQTFGVYLEKSQAKIAVDAYRKRYYLIVKMWYQLAASVMHAVKFPGQVYKTNKCACSVVKDKAGHKWLRIVLPSGRALMYMDPRVTDGKYGPVVSYHGVSQTTYQWTTRELTPGLLAENVTQASARDILCEGMLEVEHKMPEAKLILCVHDEAGALVHKNDIMEDTLDKFNELLCVDREYRQDLPLKAEGYISRRYMKG